MSGDREEKVRKLAHEKWEKSGRQEGKHLDHWHEASAEVDAGEQTSSDPAPSGTAAEALARHSKDAKGAGEAVKTAKKAKPAKP